MAIIWKLQKFGRSTFAAGRRGLRFNRRILLLLGVLSASPAFGAACGLHTSDIDVEPLAGITNDRDSSVSFMSLIVNPHGGVLGICVKTFPSLNAEVDGSDPAKPNVYWLNEIQSSKGVVLGQGQGRKAILMRGIIDSVAGHGFLTIRYLNNGLLMNYRECGVEVERQSNDRWSLINAYNGDSITTIRVKTWMLGISTLENVCPASRG